jgi:hypothetical protein
VVFRSTYHDLAGARDACAGLAVTEIATLRGELSGAQLG